MYMCVYNTKAYTVLYNFFFQILLSSGN